MHSKQSQTDEYRQRLGNSLSGDCSDYVPNDTLELALMKAMISASFIKPMKTGHGESQTKYDLMGQRVEGPALEAVWELILKMNHLEVPILMLIFNLFTSRGSCKREDSRTHATHLMA